MASNIILDDVIGFLKTVPPFQFLEEPDLKPLHRVCPSNSTPRTR